MNTGRDSGFLGRVPGIAAFLPVPITLVLFTRMPLGVDASILLGVLLMVSHRFYARPLGLGRGRCLWCGAPASSGPAIAVEDPLGPGSWRLCSEAHVARIAPVLGFAARHPVSLRLGILGPLALLLVGAPLASRGLLFHATVPDLVAFFRVGVAASVLTLSASSGEVPLPSRVPFPLHIQALLGTFWVLWLFRIVGILWLVLGIAHLAKRLQP